jgi:ferredoxin
VGADRVDDGNSEMTLVEAMASLEAAGFQGDFHVAAGPEPLVKCGSCGVTMAASAVEVIQVLRLEGESDPAEEVMVAGVRCVACGCRGVLVASYGPMADPADADVVIALANAGRRPPEP